MEIYHDSIDLDISDVKHINSYRFLPLLMLTLSLICPAGAPLRWWRGPLSTVPVFIEHILTF